MSSQTYGLVRHMLNKNEKKKEIFLGRITTLRFKSFYGLFLPADSRCGSHTHTHTHTHENINIHTNSHSPVSQGNQCLQAVQHFQTRKMFIHPDDVMRICLPGGVCVSVTANILCSCVCIGYVRRHEGFSLIRDRDKKTRTFTQVFGIIIRSLLLEVFGLSLSCGWDDLWQKSLKSKEK